MAPIVEITDDEDNIDSGSEAGFRGTQLGRRGGGDSASEESATDSEEESLPSEDEYTKRVGEQSARRWREEKGLLGDSTFAY